MRRKWYTRVTVLALVALLLAGLVATAGAATTGTTSQAKSAAGRMLGHRGPGGGSAVSTLADLTGLSTDEIRDQLKDGKSLADIAKANNIDADTLVDKAVSACQDNLSQMLADGKITQDQYDNMVSNLKTRITDEVNGTFKGGPGNGGPGNGRGFGFGAVSTLADLTGLSTDEIRDQLKDGKTLADIAKANNIDADTLIDKAVSACQDNLSQMLADGKITQDQYDNMVSNLKTRITDKVNGTFKGGPGNGCKGKGKGFGGQGSGCPSRTQGNQAANS